MAQALILALKSRSIQLQHFTPRLLYITDEPQAHATTAAARTGAEA